WAPITDLAAWYMQSSRRGDKYHQDVIACTNSQEALNFKEALGRSPLHWLNADLPKSPLKIYAGIHDGYTGSVPISHSINFYNRVAELHGDMENIITHQEAIDLMSRSAIPSQEITISDRPVFAMKN